MGVVEAGVEEELKVVREGGRNGDGKPSETGRGAGGRGWQEGGPDAAMIYRALMAMKEAGGCERPGRQLGLCR